MPTFRIGLSDGGVVAGGLWRGGANGSWWVEGVESLPAGYAGVQFFPDTPWDGSAQLGKLSRGDELTPEAGPVRRKRLEEGWVAAGFVFVETGAGSVPVRKVDIDLAKLAGEASARVAGLSSVEHLAVGVSGSGGVSGVVSGGDGGGVGWRGYVGHGIVLVVALVLGGVIVKVLLLGGGGDWERVG